MALLRCRFAVAMLLAAMPAAIPAAAPIDIDHLAREVDRAEGVRAVKDLQRAYAHYAQFGLWDEMASLFAKRGTLTFDATTVNGRAGIAGFLGTRYGSGRPGLARGAINTQLIDVPLVNLSADGTTAKARWLGFFLRADDKGAASIEGGVYENDYVKEDGVWKIAALNFTPQYVGPYETGWTNWGGKDLGVVPFHFTADESGVPLPPAAGPAPRAKASIAELERRIAAMGEADKVRNLQHAYGYYVDRKMWDDVADLFAADGLLEIGGVGVYRGPAGVRRAMERMGPAGLTHGQLNDRPQFDTIVTVMPGGREAYARGIELGMLGEADKGEAHWQVSVFHNRFVKEGGLWKLREMRVFPLFKSDYAQGWGKSRIVDPVPTGRLAPDAPVPAADRIAADRLLPAFLSPNPVTGSKIATPAGFSLAATAPLTGRIAAPPEPAPRDMAARLAEASRRLAVAKAYDGAENVSSAYGLYIDDGQWPQMGAIFGKKGAKQVPFAGFYIGSERITRYGVEQYGQPPVTRPGISFHWRIQPVILVAADGRSANIRTRLFQPRTSKEQSKPGAFLGASMYAGMYQDQAVLEDGIWRLWNLALDEPYFTSTDWKGGWAAVKPAPPGVKRPPSAILKKYPPDIPITALGKREEHFLGGTGETIQWPGIQPMWFPYRNLVSGRTPENFIGDCAPCDYAPDLSMTRHGYLLPPTGPEPDAGPTAAALPGIGRPAQAALPAGSSRMAAR